MKAFMAHHSAYIDTIDQKGHKHHYRLSPSELAQSDWIEESITGMRFPTFKLSQIISDESARKLWLAVKGA